MSVGGGTHKILMQEALEGSKTQLLQHDRLSAALREHTSDKTARLFYGNSIKQSTERAIGSNTTSKHLKKWFVELSLVHADLMARVRGDAAPTPERHVVPDYVPSRIGEVEVSYSLEDSHYINITETDSSFTFHVHCPGHIETPILSFESRWHPFWSLPLKTSLFVSMFGLSSETPLIGIKDMAQKFSPAHFRTDLTAVEVMDAVASCKSPGEQMRILRYIGFNDIEINTIIEHAHRIPIYRHLQEVSDYTGLDDISKCIVTDRLRS